MSYDNEKKRYLFDAKGSLYLDLKNPENKKLIIDIKKVEETLHAFPNNELTYLSDRVERIYSNIFSENRGMHHHSRFHDIPLKEISEFGEQVKSLTQGILFRLFPPNDEQKEVYRDFFNSWDIGFGDIIIFEILNPIRIALKDSLSSEKKNTQIPHDDKPTYIQYGIENGYIQSVGDGTDGYFFLSGICRLREWEIGFERETGNPFPKPKSLEDVLRKKTKNGYEKYKSGTIRNYLSKK